MDAKLKTIIRNLNEEARESQLDFSEWWPILTTRVSGSELKVIHEDMTQGEIACKNPTVQKIIASRHSWMTEPYTPPKSKISYDPWIVRIQSAGVSRPNDILHLSTIARYATNPEAFALFI